MYVDKNLVVHLPSQIFPLPRGLGDYSKFLQEILKTSYNYNNTYNQSVLRLLLEYRETLGTGRSRPVPVYPA